MIIESKFLKAEFSETGAELTSLHDQFGAQYIWQGQGDHWPGKAPIMFPICGFLKENFFYYGKDQYFMQVHGFARTSKFEVLEHELNKISFGLRSSARSLQHYPFTFDFKITYELSDNELKVNFEVMNTGEQRMYYAFGWHPGFALNWVTDDSIDNYYLAFPSSENLKRRPVNEDGLLHGDLKEITVNENKTLSLNKESFDERAIVLENYPHTEVSLRHIQSSKSIDMKLEGFPHFTLWGQRNVNFLCLEPWLGLGDFDSHNQKIQDKQGILKLSSGHKHQASCSLIINN